MRNVVVAIALLGLAACGSEPASDSAADAAASAAPTEVAAVAAVATPTGAAAPASFASCKACYAVVPGQHGIGPSLAGVHGSKAGSAAGYAYSPANRASGVTWDDATLDTYLKAPAKAMPGTKMTYAGMADPAKRAEVIEYMKALK